MGSRPVDTKRCPKKPRLRRSLLTGFPFHTRRDPRSEARLTTTPVHMVPGRAATGTLAFESRSVRLLGTTVTLPDPRTPVNSNSELSLIHISEPTRLGMISYAVFCLKKKKKKQ